MNLLFATWFGQAATILHRHARTVIIAALFSGVAALVHLAFVIVRRFELG